MNRIPDLCYQKYDVEHAARTIARHCVVQLCKDKGADRETNANATLHSAVLAEMLAFKEQLDSAVVSAFRFGLEKLGK